MQRLQRVRKNDLGRYIAAVQDLLDQIGSISVCLKGPFLGTRNTGRIYFPVYPQKVRDEDVFALVQKRIGVSPTKLYLVGYYHLCHELDPLETRELAELIDRWRDRIIVRTTIPFLELHATNDDLALSGRTHARIGGKASGLIPATPSYRASSKIIAAPLSAIIAVGVLVLPDVIVGMTDASAIRKPAMP